VTATGEPFRVALTEFVEVQVSVELPPVVIDVGLAVIPAVGDPAATVTVVWPQSVAPVELCAVMR
jgi:hypothetical protein